VQTGAFSFGGQMAHIHISPADGSFFAVCRRHPTSDCSGFRWNLCGSTLMIFLLAPRCGRRHGRIENG
jgi:hypothetical protein